MFKAIQSPEDAAATREKARVVTQTILATKLSSAAQVAEGCPSGKRAILNNAGQGSSSVFMQLRSRALTLPL